MFVNNVALQGKFKHATGSVVAQANARNYALGVEGVSYEGPLRVRLPVHKRLDPDGSFSFEIPLPNPDRQVLLKRFAGGFKQALSSPLSVQQVAKQIATQTISSQPSMGSGTASPVFEPALFAVVQGWRRWLLLCITLLHQHGWLW